MCNRLTKLLLIATIFSVHPLALHAQGVQAARGIARMTEERFDAQARRAKALVRDEVEQYRLVASLAAPSAPRFIASNEEERRQLSVAYVWASLLVGQGETLLHSDDDRALFRELFERYKATRKSEAVAASATINMLSMSTSAAVEIESIVLPPLTTLVPDVAFTVGPEFGFGRTNSGAVAIGTNLVGAVASSAFSALGSEALQKYFQDNVAIGTSLPTNGSKKISAQLGLGLGSFRIGNRSTIVNGKPATEARLQFWPVLQVEQHDTADAQVPRDLVTRFAKEKTWTSPVIAVAIVGYSSEKLEQRAKDGKFVLIPVVGVRLPYFFPGDVFSALTALFSEHRSDFERAGKAQFVVGLSLPVPRLGAGSE
ncbi:MAG: hypothetical protein ABIT38_13680 [Gemmatimonadaceae bacterium]